jgi:cytochrome c2
MTNSKRIKRLLLITITIFAVSVYHLHAQDAAASAAGSGGADAEGKQLFTTKCQACHSGDMKANSTGPALGGVETRWTDNTKLHEWIKNNVKLTATGYAKAVEVSKLTPIVMQTFDELSDTQITAVLKYVDDKFSGKLDVPVAAANVPKGVPEAGDSQNKFLFGLLSLILALVAVVLIFVNKNLKRLSNDIDGIPNVPDVPVYYNKTYLAIAAIVFFILGGYLTTKALINTNRQTNYQPTQPIFYSHKVHAGLNQVNCLYCHGNAWESKAATIPSVNVCMNCHKTIQNYTKGPQLKDALGNIIDGTVEIAKLYKYAGFDPQNPNNWDASKATPIEWVKIHNLPDHVYFNHSQHVRVGNVQCQTCHGEVTNMDEMKQFAELSMGWCVNCHRQTKVNFNYDSTKGNKFYSIYEKFHNDIKAGKMDSITVKDIGGIECQKCHY